MTISSYAMFFQGDVFKHWSPCSYVLRCAPIGFSHPRGFACNNGDRLRERVVKSLICLRRETVIEGSKRMHHARVPQRFRRQYGRDPLPANGTQSPSAWPPHRVAHYHGRAGQIEQLFGDSLNVTLART